MTIQLHPTTGNAAVISNSSQTRGFSPDSGNHGLLEVLVARAVGHFTVLQAWNERSRQRRHLSELDSRLLADIGVSRAAATHEAAKQPWQA